MCAILLVVFFFSLGGSPNFAQGQNLPLSEKSETFFEHFRNPPRCFTMMPFWFWNDTLDEAEIIRQIADFEAHGVYGFVIHPRIGLPEDCGWMSPKLLAAMRVALAEARRRGMYVLLYDEGMYPSGSSAGQVAATNPRFAARGFFMVELPDLEETSPSVQPTSTAPSTQTTQATSSTQTTQSNSDELNAGSAAIPDPHPEPLWDLLTVQTRPNGKRIAIYERPSQGVIRGLHYLNEGTRKQRESQPLAGNILDPEAVACYQKLVYERYFEEFGEFFGTTILGVFTDEPSELGRGAVKGVVPGNAQALKRVSELLGYDFTPYLADLWFTDSPESASRRKAYYQALHRVLLETYYQPLSEWCSAHGAALCGHPANSNDLASESVFQIPGQDIVWRYVEPGEKALVGAHSTNAKVASSAMTNFGRSRNLNELYGAYGHNLTFEEVRWLANWVLIRGQNLLVPHAFYYSVRGPRHEERPPDVGPHSAWWNDGFHAYADACRRISWLNSGTPVLHTVILTDGVSVPDAPTRSLFENQIDFNYLEMSQVLKDGKVDSEGLHLAGMTWKAIVLPRDGDVIPSGFFESEMMKKLAADGRLVRWRSEETKDEYIKEIQNLLFGASSDLVRLSGRNAAGLRLRQVRIEGMECVMLFNETAEVAEISLSNLPSGQRFWLDPDSGTASPCNSTENIPFQKFEFRILAIQHEP